MSNHNPIGIFDSGVGGLSIARGIREALPNENILYLADSAHAPYGDQSSDFIYQRSSALIQFLLENGAKAIVIACNTATVSAIEKLREEFSIPIIGVEPGIKPAITNSTNGVIGVIATTRTLSSLSFKKLSKRLASDARIEVQPCPGLVEQVESLQLGAEKTEQLVRQYLSPLLAKGADNIVLGCTHYAFLTPIIRKIVGPEITITNTATAVAREVARRLDSQQLLNSKQSAGSDIFWSSSTTGTACSQFSTLWGSSVKVLTMKV